MDGDENRIPYPAITWGGIPFGQPNVATATARFVLFRVFSKTWHHIYTGDDGDDDDDDDYDDEDDDSDVFIHFSVPRLYIQPS